MRVSVGRGGVCTAFSIACPILYRKNTKCYDMTSTTHFLVPFGLIFQIFFFKFFLIFFPTPDNFLIAWDPPYGEKFECFLNVFFDSSN